MDSDASGNDGQWRWVAISSVGSSHVRAGVGCDDAHLAENEGSIEEGSAVILAVSDGAGSASHSRQGAQVAVDAFAATVRQLLSYHPLHELADHKEAIVDSVRYQIALLARSIGVEDRQCACTLVAAVLGPSGSFYLQLGDGAIVTRADEPEGQWQPVFWPQQGEYANTTFFLTQTDAPMRAVSRYEGTPLADIVLLTDGLQTLALKYQDQSAHQPFFNFVARDVLASESTGDLTDASARLSEFLLSDQVNSRTDDDKTLIVASKRSNRAPR